MRSGRVCVPAGVVRRPAVRRCDAGGVRPRGGAPAAGADAAAVPFEPGPWPPGLSSLGLDAPPGLDAPAARRVEVRVAHKPVAGFFNRVLGSVRFGKITLMFPKISKTFVLFTFGLLFVA